MPGRRTSDALLVAGGLGLPAAFAAVLILDLPQGTLEFGLAWNTVWAVAYLAAVWAYRREPENLAARRLLAFACLGMLYQPLNFVAVDLYLELGESFGVAALNFAMTLLFLLAPAALLGLLATYPDGNYQCRSERWLTQAAVAAGLLLPLAALLVGPDLVVTQAFLWSAENVGAIAVPSFPSPFEIGPLAWLSAIADGYGETALGICAGLGAITLALRFRRFRGSPGRRLQIRWVAYAALACLLAPPLFALEAAGVISPFLRDLGGLFILLLVPASLAIGIARPELFDVDRAVRRSSVYLLIWAAVGGIYAGVAALLGIAAGGESIQIAVAVAVVATVAFEPVRRNVVDRVSRRLFGEIVSGEELVRRLGGALASTTEIEELAAEIALAAREGLSAEWVAVEIDGYPTAASGPAPDGALAEAGDPERDGVLVAPLEHGEGVLGRIVCGPRPRPPLERDDRELLTTLARQAALAIHNADLTNELGRRLEELRLQAEELTASRSRIVAAEEQARRRIERDIHDGVQQELVALIARMGLAKSQLGRDPGRAAETLDDLRDEAAQALEHVRDLASGIHPSVLSDRGLVEAIETRASRLPVGVTIESEPRLRDLRFTEELEGAIYFFVGECLANAMKHAGCERVRVRLGLDGVPGEEQLRVSVVDRGKGFDPEATALRGLAGLRDRVEALGGTVVVESAPGEGTEVTARLEARERVAAD